MGWRSDNFTFFFVVLLQLYKSASEIHCKKKLFRGKVSISFYIFFFVVQHLNGGVLWGNNKINLIYSQFVMLLIAADDDGESQDTIKGNFRKFSNAIFMFFLPDILRLKNEYATSDKDTWKERMKNVAKQQRGAWKHEILIWHNTNYIASTNWCSVYFLRA